MTLKFLVVFLASLILSCNHTNPKSLVAVSWGPAASLVVPSSYPDSATIGYGAIFNDSKEDISDLELKFNGKSTEQCQKIAANSDCAFSFPIDKPVTITAVSGSGINLTTKVGLITATQQKSKDGITLFYQNKIAGSRVAIVAMVNSNDLKNFNEIALTTVSGRTLNYEVLSGNTGVGMTNLAATSIVTLILSIPSGVKSHAFYTQTLKDGKVVSQGSHAHRVKAYYPTAETANKAQKNSKKYAQTAVVGMNGIVVSQNYVSLMPGDSQTLTYTNYGTAPVWLNIVLYQNTQNNLTLTQTTECGWFLNTGNTCDVTITNSTGSNSTFNVGNAALVATDNSTGQMSGFTQINLVSDGSVTSAGIIMTGSDDPSLMFYSNKSSYEIEFDITNPQTNQTGISVSVLAPTDSSIVLNQDNPSNPNSCANSGNLNFAIANCSASIAYNPEAQSSSGEQLGTIQFTDNYFSSIINTAYFTYANETSEPALSVSSVNDQTVFTNIHNDGASNAQITFTILNIGEAPALNISPSIIGENSTVFSVSKNTCPPKGLAPEKSCQITVQFGPTAQLGLLSSSLEIIYYVSDGSTYESSTNLSGSALPQNIGLTTSYSSFIAGEGSKTKPLINTASSDGIITLTYTNNDTAQISNFTTTHSTINSPWSSSKHGCNSVTLSPAGTCTDVYYLNSSNSGTQKFDFKSVTITTGADNVSFGALYPNTSRYIHAKIVDDPVINLSASSGVLKSSGNLVTTTLTGGYKVASTRVTPQISPDDGVLTTSSNCVLSSESPSCQSTYSSSKTIENYYTVNLISKLSTKNTEIFFYPASFLTTTPSMTANAPAPPVTAVINGTTWPQGSIEIFNNFNNDLYAIMDRTGYLYKSPTKKLAWTLINTPAGINILSMCVDQKDNIFYSTPAGYNLSYLSLLSNTGAGTATQLQVALTANVLGCTEKEIYYVLGGKIYSINSASPSVPTVAASTLPDGIVASNIHHIVIDASNNIYIDDGSNVYRYFKKNSSWSQLGGSTPGSTPGISVFSVIGNNVFVGNYQDSRVYFTGISNTSSWTSFPAGPSPDDDEIKAIAPNPLIKGGITIIGHVYSVYTATARDTSWTPLSKNVNGWLNVISASTGPAILDRSGNIFGAYGNTLSWAHFNYNPPPSD